MLGEKERLTSRNMILKQVVTKGRVKTPKSILLPTLIKCLTNNIEVNNLWIATALY